MEGERKNFEKRFNKTLYSKWSISGLVLKCQNGSILKVSPLTLSFNIVVLFCLKNGPG